MIIAALEIENYKQYAGSHRIDFPEQGIVAVTGPNGAGKTTLFEAIEWCLYCPRAIPQATVPPHDGVGRTVVRVTLEDLSDGKRYCVQRELRAGGTQAEIYLEDDPGEPIVQGTREVSRYVARHLIGLPHPAFVSTFFTKQKELQFFGDRSATERRTEVGRLLGLEAVREAQKDIGEGRASARSSADLLRGEYQRRLGERNLADEIDLAKQTLRDAETREADAEGSSAQAAAEAEAARVELERLRELQSEDAALRHELADLAGAVAGSTARRDGAGAELKRLEQRASERMQLAATALASERLTADIAEHEAQRELLRRQQALQLARATALETAAGIARRLEQIVAQHRVAATGMVGWTWSDEDARDVVTSARRLRAIAVAADPNERRARVEALLEARRCHTTASETEATRQKYQRFRASLIDQRAALLAEGDPTEALMATAQAIRDAREDENRVRLAISEARGDRVENERLAEGLRQHLQAPICPTCTRPLGPEEAERLEAALQVRIRQRAEDERVQSESAKAVAARIIVAERAETDARKRQDDLRSLTERIAEGQKRIEDEEERLQRAEASLQGALALLGLTNAPSPEDVDEARTHAEQMEQIFGLAGLLDRLGDDAENATKARVDAEMRLQELGDVHFDEAAYLAAVTALDAARRAAAQVERIDIELANQAEYERQRAEAERELAALSGKQMATEAKRAARAFDPAALRIALESEQATRQAAQMAREVHAGARQAVRDAQGGLERIQREQEHLLELIEESERKTREADDLTRMYEEFGEFDQYVARHVGPLLAETTERMLAQVTNGKYDHVQFDENYGIEVFDGDEAFPLSGFSGGERDVVALCARLALSEVVGSSALRPPRFLVLDEVFGSLDSERRVQLLETLGALANSGHFRQMFIISHIDDVQQSPVMNEAWIIEERDGVSRVVRPETFIPAMA